MTHHHQSLLGLRFIVANAELSFHPAATSAQRLAGIVTAIQQVPPGPVVSVVVRRDSWALSADLGSRAPEHIQLALDTMVETLNDV